MLDRLLTNQLIIPLYDFLLTDLVVLCSHSVQVIPFSWEHITLSLLQLTLGDLLNFISGAHSS